MSKLSDDLDKEYRELKQALNAREVIRGIRILSVIASEFTAIAALVIAAITAANTLTGGLASLGIPISAGAIHAALRQGLPQILKQYENLSREDRMAVKKALVFFHLSPSFFI
jgi:hypothetical protein